MLHYRLNDTPRLIGRVLILICSFRGGIRNAPPFSLAARIPALGFIGRLFDRLTLLPLRRFIADNRDFFANPRDLAYQARLVRDLLIFGQPREVVCVVDETLSLSPALEEFKKFGSVECRPAGKMADGIERFDTVALVYPDALGLGWGPLEENLRYARARNVVFVNGRRRVMTMDIYAADGLAWRRFLAQTRIIELLLAFIVVPTAAVCAAIDALRGRA
jgi:hypothetical protein